MIDINEIKTRLSRDAAGIAAHLLPRGKRHGHEWSVGSVQGEPGDSLRVHLDGPKAGVWCDFASNDSGDLIDLWQAVKGVKLPEALDEIRG